MPSHLGEFEQLLLLALLRLEGAGYGATLQNHLRDQGGRTASLGTIYKTLFRLEAKGLVTGQLGDPTPERGGRRKKHYRVTASGHQALQRSLLALRRLSQGLDPALELP